jgi:hypothetical protein
VGSTGLAGVGLGVLASRLEQQHSEQLTTRKNATRPPSETAYHTSDHVSTNRLSSERKRIDAKCQFRFPHGGRKRQGNIPSLASSTKTISGSVFSLVVRDVQ